jgi:hypothetical protein
MHTVVIAVLMSVVRIVMHLNMRGVATGASMEFRSDKAKTVGTIVYIKPSLKVGLENILYRE